MAVADDDALIVLTMISTLPVPVDSALIVVPEPAWVTLAVVVTFRLPLPVVIKSSTPVAEPVDSISPPSASCLNSMPA